jgi:hypothetical protein
MKFEFICKLSLLGPDEHYYLILNVKNLYRGRLSKNRLDFLSDLGSEP